MQISDFELWWKILSTFPTYVISLVSGLCGRLSYKGKINGNDVDDVEYIAIYVRKVEGKDL